MDNVIEIKDYLKNLDGVNGDIFEQSLDKHFASVSDIKNVEELAERVDTYRANGQDVVNKELGIIEFKKLARSPQEIITFCESQGYGRSA